MRLHQHTRRNTILYASAWLQKLDASASVLSINDEDTQALMEVTRGLSDDALDLVLHSPGGSPEAAEGIVLCLRARFSNMRVIVPNLAMSAADAWTARARPPGPVRNRVAIVEAVGGQW